MTTAVQHLPAAQLELTERQLEALLWVRSQLATGKLIHKPVDVLGDGCKNVSLPALAGFNMDRWAINTDCGTVCCIGGSMEAYMTTTHGESFDGGEAFATTELFKLFNPPEISDWTEISPEAAIEAIDNYVLTGKANWEDIGRKYGYELC